MQRSAKRSRKAAKPHGETGPAQKVFATVGSAVRDGACTGLLSAHLNVAPILFFTAMSGRSAPACFCKLTPGGATSHYVALGSLPKFAWHWRGIETNRAGRTHIRRYTSRGPVDPIT